LKTQLVRFTIIFLVSMGLFTSVLADESGDPTEVNKLLSDGKREVTADQLLVNATFDSKTDWRDYSDDNTQLGVGDGVYHISVKGKNSTFGLNFKPQTDTVIQVKATQISEKSNNAYGVICRSTTNGNGDGYYFLISGNGYAINLVKGTNTTLVAWTPSKAINVGQDENDITVVCVKNYLAMYINDVLVAETTDDTFWTGDPGLTVSGFSEGKEVAVDFDDVRIWSASFADGSGTNTAENTSSDLPSALTSYDGKPKEAIAELEQLSVIPSGSSQIFNENHAFFTGQGNWFTPLASRSPHKNIVMGAELTFTVGSTSEFESCSLISRIKMNDQGTATTYVQVGIGNDSYAYILDRYSEAQDSNLEVGSTSYNLKQPHHVLFTLINDAANVYIDGNLEITNFTIGERSGTYGISLSGRGPKARCDGRNLWAFAVPSVQPGQCAVSSTKVANKRSGPGTTFDAAGQLAAGDEVVVSGQAKGADGKNWWQLEDETWVRSDLVTAVGDCANVPIIKP